MISMIISVPLVMYINFYLPARSHFAAIIRFSLDILFGVPSIVFGAFGFALMVYMGIKASLLGRHYYGRNVNYAFDDAFT